MSSPVTVLTSEEGKLATKRWYRSKDGKIESDGYGSGLHFSADVEQIGSIGDFYQLLSSLETKYRSFIIRGVLGRGIDSTKTVMRKSTPDPNGKVWFVEHQRGLRWGMLDFDKVPAPSGTNLISDPEGAIEYLIGLLPEDFWDASCVWQLSSSAGMNGEDFICAHLFYYFDREVTNTELNALVKQINSNAGHKLIDPAPFRTVQPHYTAAPLFDDDIPDPIQRRLGFRNGLEDEVIFPEIELTDQVYTGSSDGVLRHAHGFEAKLGHLGDGQDLAGFHAPLLEAVASYVGTHGSNGTDPEALKHRLREAIDAAPKGPGRDVSRYMSDQYLDDIINSAIHKFGQREELPCRVTPRYPAPSGTVEEAWQVIRKEFFAWSVSLPDYWDEEAAFDSYMSELREGRL
jgi:hypothetical protein